jgi:TonB family protein
MTTATARLSPSIVTDRVGWRHRLASGATGVGISGLILFGLSQAQKTKVPPPPPPIEDLRAVVLSVPPPPPPRVEMLEPPPPMPVQLETAPSASAIKIALAPPSVPAARPLAKPNFDFSPDAFRPDGETRTWSPDHVFQRSDVDQPPVAVFRKTPDIPFSLLRRIATPRVTLLFIVTTDGKAKDIRLVHSVEPEFDARILDALREWRFRPAIRNGRKVNCMVHQGITVRTADPSPFSVP